MALTKWVLWINLLVTYTIHLFVAMKILPSVALNITDALAILLFLCFIIELLRNGGARLPVKYVVFAGVLLALIGISALANGQSTGSMLLGLKTYFPLIPFFILPFACRFEFEDIKPFLIGFLVIAVLQFPLAFYQRFVLFREFMHTGDYIVGTLGLSSYLSIFLLCIIAVLMGFYLKGRLSLPKLLVLILVLMAPTTVNETKGTMFLLPIALAGPAVFLAIIEKRILHLLPVAGFLGLAFAGFIAIFNMIDIAGEKGGLSERDLMSYTFMARDIEIRASDSPVIGKREVNRIRDIGRGDAMLYAFKVVGQDPFTLMIGKGLGNMTDTGIDLLKGDYDKYAHLLPMYTVVSVLTWEVGIIGLMMAFWINYAVFKDTWAVAKSEGPDADFAIGWAAVIIMLTLSMFYKDIIWGAVLGSFYWFFCGYFCARRVRGAQVVPEPMETEINRPMLVNA